MSRISRRKRVIEDLEEWVVGRKFVEMCQDESESDEDSMQDNMLDLPSHLLQIVNFSRYLERNDVPKSQDFYLNVLPILDDERFKQEIRMSRESFDNILSQISKDTVFANKSNTGQADVKLQFMICAYRFGSSGSSAAVGKIARHFGVSEGFVIKSTDRCIEALLKREKIEVTWPDDDEREAIKTRILNESGFPDCIGMVDGTLIPLQFKPSKDGADYWSHKSKYGIAAMIVCDDRRKIRYVFAGFCGSAHDMRVYSNSKLSSSADSFFKAGEYLLGDSGYTTTIRTVSSYKKPLANLQENERFNRCLSSMRIRVEHCIGILKGRFPSLQSLRTQIKDVETHKRAVLWIKACVVLNNMLLSDSFYEDSWKEVEKCNSSSGRTGTKNWTEDGKQFREAVKQKLLTNRGYQ